MTLTSEQKQRLANVATSDISDAMERIGLRRSVIAGFSCTLGDKSTVVGRALTVKQAPKRPPATSSDRLTRHGEVSKELAQPGDFVVVDAGGRTDVASWGGHHSGRCHERGISGVLINGATRDIAEIRRMGFPAYYLGTSPISSRWDQETAEINGSVTIGGVQIKGGDILVGDEDGLVVISVNEIEQVIAALK